MTEATSLVLALRWVAIISLLDFVVTRRVGGAERPVAETARKGFL
jgi:hypothetical protein